MLRSAPPRVAVCALAAAASLAGGLLVAPVAAAAPRPLPDVSNAHDKRPDLVDNHGRKLG